MYKTLRCINESVFVSTYKKKNKNGNLIIKVFVDVLRLDLKENKSLNYAVM